MFPQNEVFAWLLKAVCQFGQTRWFALLVFGGLMMWAICLRRFFSSIKSKYDNHAAGVPPTDFVKFENEGLWQRTGMVIRAAVSTLPLGFVMFLVEDNIRSAFSGTKVASGGEGSAQAIMMIQLLVFVAIVFLKFGSLGSATGAFRNMKKAKL